jgi:hypothetical protein
MRRPNRYVKVCLREIDFYEKVSSLEKIWYTEMVYEMEFLQA